MTISCQPMDATAGSPAYSAQVERQNMAPLYNGGSGLALAARSGFRVGTASNILTCSSTTWILVPCSAVITPGASTAQGSYRWASDSNISGPLTPADATYARKDIVYIRVNDASSGDGSGALSAPVLYLAGEPNANPQPPALPSRSFLVGTINVPQLGGGSPTVVLNPARFVAAGGIQPVFSLDERNALDKYDTLTVRRADLPTQPLQSWSAAASKWLTMGGPGTAYTPIWTGVADFGSGGSLTGTYWLSGDRVHVRSRARFGAGSQGMGTGIVRCPLPPGYPVAGTESKHLGSGNFFPASGSIRALTVFEDAGAASVWVASDPIKTPGEAGLSNANNSFFEIAFSYQTNAV